MRLLLDTHIAEPLTLVSNDAVLARYSADIRIVLTPLRSPIRP